MAETTHAHFDWNTYIELCERLVARVAKSGVGSLILCCASRAAACVPGTFLAVSTASRWRL